MVKPEWGTKRTCVTCSSRFYDLNNKPATCPKCGAVLESMSSSGKSRKSKADKARELLQIDDPMLAAGLDFGHGDIVTDDALIDDEEVLDEGLDDLSLVEDDDH